MNDTTPSKRLGQRIKEARKDAGLNQTELASLCGWETENDEGELEPSQSRVSNYEQGRREASLEDMIKLGAALGKPLVYFYDIESVSALVDSGTSAPRPEEIKAMADMLSPSDGVLLIKYLSENLPLEDLAKASSALSSAISNNLEAPDTSSSDPQE